MAKKTQTAPKSFEDALREVEQILGEIESGSIGLEESLVKHERGAFLIQHCRGVLDRAEKHIELLSHAPGEQKLRVESVKASDIAPASDEDESDDDEEGEPAPF